ncbi:MAG: hypothetical protein ABI580_06985 [Burkholderiaceae bacterium]
MREHFDVATRALCGAGAVPGACLAGVVTLLLGGACFAYAFVVPGLFGAVAAAVVAAERLLCAARSSTTKAAVGWTCVAFGWIVVASSMLHSPLVSVRLLQWMVVLLVVSSVARRLWARLEASGPEWAPSGLWVVCAGVVAQLAMLFGATAAPLARIAAVAAIELIVIGGISLLQAGGYRHEASDAATHAVPRLGATANVTAGTVELETAVA